MDARIIVCVNQQGAIAAPFRRGTLEPCREFQPDGAGREGFAQLLRAHPGVPVYLMADSVEESYQSETLPHVTGGAREEMLARRLKQIYRGAPYHAAWLQGREADKRRDDRYLCAALTNADVLRPWVDVVQALGLPLAGVFLLPMVSQVLVRRLRLADAELLLVSRHSSGLRQSFFQGGQLKTSRLAVLDPEADSVELLAGEVVKTRLYLGSLRLLSREGTLAVLLVDEGDALAPLEARLQQEGGFLCQRLQCSEAAARAGCRLSGADGPYGLHMAVLGLAPPEGDLAPDDATRGFRHYRQRRLLYAAAVILGSVALLWGGVNLYLVHRIGQETARLEAQARDQQARYQAAAMSFPKAPTSAENLEKVVRAAARIKEDSRTPERLMGAVSRSLETSGDIQLTSLDWKYGPASRPEGAAESPFAPAGIKGWQESGTVAGEVRPFHGDYRAAMASVNAWIGKLRKDPAVAGVSVQQLPLNIQSSSALSGNTLDAGGGDQARAEFRVRVALKEPT